MSAAADSSAECKGKNGFDHYVHAQHAIKKMRQSARYRKRDRTVASAYRCPSCRKWHVGENFFRE